MKFGQKDLDVPYIRLGHLTSNSETKVYVSQQALFNRHCAVVGTTGGKSWTIAKLIESMTSNKSKVILLDPTGEYTAIKRCTICCHRRKCFFRIEI